MKEGRQGGERRGKGGGKEEEGINGVGKEGEEGGEEGEGGGEGNRAIEHAKVRLH